MIRKKEKDWFNLKKYPHIGFPLNPQDRFKWIEKYITDPEKIAKHSFLPFIHKTTRVRKFRKDYSTNNGEINSEYIKDNKIHRKSGEKKRELFYASHLDSLVFSYYAKVLSENYELKLKNKDYNLDEVVNAYRSIPVDSKIANGSNKCNIDFANDIFKYILNYEENEFIVIAFDISSFFDNLNHKLLRDMWLEVLGVEKLPPDHFNVFKNITRFSYVDIVDIFNEFKEHIYTRKINKFGRPLEIKQKSFDRIKYLRNQDAIAFCKEKEFFEVKGKLLQPSKTKKLKDGKIIYRDFGIPQGSPISSILANIYLLSFDKTINNFILRNKGVYRRYSDDMIVVCPKEHKESIIELVNRELEKYKLEIQKTKTQVFHFKREGKKLLCGQEFLEGINWNKKLIYLGFEFDGQNVLLKSASLSGFYRKMKRYVRRAKRFSSYKKVKTSGEIFRKRIFKKFSYKGAKRIRKFIWNKKEGKFEKLDSYNWGNFLTYTKKASKIMVNNKISKQTKRHWNVLNDLIK